MRCMVATPGFQSVECEKLRVISALFSGSQPLMAYAVDALGTISSLSTHFLALVSVLV